MMTLESGYSIQTMAARCGMTAHTLRYYERIGLIDPIDRRRNGHRCYSNADEAWMKFLHWLRATRMPIREIRRYAALRDRGQEGVQDRRKVLEDHRAALDDEIAKLRRARASLAHCIESLCHIEDTMKAAPSVLASTWAPEGVNAPGLEAPLGIE